MFGILQFGKLQIFKILQFGRSSNFQNFTIWKIIKFSKSYNLVYNLVNYKIFEILQLGKL